MDKEKTIMAQKKRSLLSPTNTYQRQIITITFFVPFVFCLVIYILVSLLEKDLVHVLLNSSPAQVAQFVSHWMALTTISLSGILLFFFIIAFYLSQNLVGAFERIIHEMDDVIQGKKASPIQARPKDTLANELLKRINILIKNYKK